MNGHIKGAESPTKLTTGSTLLMPETYSVNDYILVKLHQNSNNREFRAATGGVLHRSGGAPKDTVEFGSQKLASSCLRADVRSPSHPGPVRHHPAWCNDHFQSGRRGENLLLLDN